ncbi:MAG TPA: serine hydroxymethyltransferase [Chloroflexi bacterium]|jgi:glycine hydroxymethyltransferase|nr:serine hydroxymethyltransferase [Chloroflexota bacterium]
MSALSTSDLEAYEIVQRETERQSDDIVLIASENHASRAVLEATGSVLTDKYAEGYPHKRYYGGCEYVDEAEELAVERAKQLFGAEHANVQPHAGAMANMASYAACLEYGDRVLAMNLKHGGHLTHGGGFNFSGKLYEFQWYGVDEQTEQIDYDAVQKQAEEFQPKLLVAGASAYSRLFDFPRLRQIADSVGARFMFDMAHVAGLVAGGVHPNPVEHADIVTSTTHKTLRGPRGGLILCREELAKKVNSGVFPYMQGGPFMHQILAKAVAFGEALQPAFKEYARQVVRNARDLSTQLQARGFSIVSGGTDNHLFVLDFRKSDLTGKRAQEALESVGLVTNKNLVPFDTRNSVHTSGLRVGTPSATTRGMKTEEMKLIADWIAERLAAPDDPETEGTIASQVRALTRDFPIPAAVLPVPA